MRTNNKVGEYNIILVHNLSTGLCAVNLVEESSRARKLFADKASGGNPPFGITLYIVLVLCPTLSSSL